MVEKNPVGRPTEHIAQDEKAQALALLAINEGNLAQTSRETGLTPYKLRKLRDTNYELYETVRYRVAEGLLDKTLLITDVTLDEIHRRMTDPELIQDMKVKDLMVISAIGIDKINVMTVVRGKFGATRRATEEFEKMTEEEIMEAIEGEFEVISDEVAKEAKDTNEDMSDTPEDELHAKERRVPPAGPFLHRSSGETP